MDVSAHKVVVCGGGGFIGGQAHLEWEPSTLLTYDWIESQIEAAACV